MSRNLSCRRKQFALSIRKQVVQNIKKQIRSSMQNSVETLNVTKLAQMFLIEHKSQHTLTLFDIVDCYRPQLLNPPSAKSRQIPIEQPMKLALAEHINFWTTFQTSLVEHSEQSDKRLLEFVLEFMQANQHKHVHHSTHLELRFLNCLELACRFFNEKEKSIVLDWVQGTEALRVVKACLTSKKFLSIHCFPNIYQLIELGLGSEIKQESKQAAQTLALMLQEADWDDTFTVYQHFHNFAIILMKKIRRYYQSEDIEDYANCMFCLLDCYDRAVVDYATNGVALCGVELSLCKIDCNIIKGLFLLRMITQVEETKIINFLLNDEDINFAGFWDLFCRSDTLRTHRNISIRSNYYEIIRCIFSHGDHKCVNQFAQKFTLEQKDIFFLFEQALANQSEEPEIIHGVMENIRTMIYYGEEFKEPNSHNKVLHIIASRGLIQLIEKHQYGPSQYNVDLASELLKCIEGVFERENQQLLNGSR